jgi:hypothetical protein
VKWREPRTYLGSIRERWEETTPSQRTEASVPRAELQGQLPARPDHPARTLTGSAAGLTANSALAELSGAELAAERRARGMPRGSGWQSRFDVTPRRTRKARRFSLASQFVSFREFVWAAIKSRRPAGELAVAVARDGSSAISKRLVAQVSRGGARLHITHV